MTDTNPTGYTALRNESGVALLLTMMLMLMLSLLTMSLYELLQTSVQITGNYELDLQTTYIADAGVEGAINELRYDPGWTTGFSNVSFSDGTYGVTILSNVLDPNPGIFRKVKIRSDGTMSGFQRRLEVEVSIIDVGGSGSYLIATTSWKLMPIL